MQFAVDSLLDGLSELVYISDPDTYQLLFVNKAGKEAYGQDIADGTHLCYAALQNRTSPCPFCTNNRPSGGAFLEWEHAPIRQKRAEWRTRINELESQAAA